MTLAFLISSTLPAVLLVLPQDATVRYVSPSAAIRSPGVGKDVIELYDSRGDVVSLMPVSERTLIPGEAGFALVGPGSDNGLRDVELLNADGELGSRLVINEEQHVVVGNSSIAVWPAAAHEEGSRYEIEFIATNGMPLARRTIGEATLMRLIAQPGGRYLAYSREGDGHSHVRAYDQDGLERWDFQAPADQVLCASLGPTGRLAVVWHLSGDGNGGAEVHLLDAAGRINARFETSPVQVAAFSANEQVVLLAGPDTVVLIDTMAKAVLWHSEAPQRLLAGLPLLVLENGFALAAKRPAGEDMSAQVRFIVLEDGSYTESSVALPDAVLDKPLVGLTDIEGHSIRVVSANQSWSILR